MVVHRLVGWLAGIKWEILKHAYLTWEAHEKRG